MCRTVFEGGGTGEEREEEGPLLERPLSKKLIAVILSTCSEVGAFLDT